MEIKLLYDNEGYYLSVSYVCNLQLECRKLIKSFKNNPIQGV